MADLFDRFATDLIKREGGATYTNRPADRGGPTRWGWTAETLGRVRNLGRAATPAEVQALTEAEARALYRSEFFVKPGFDRVATVSPRVAEELLDTGVNMGAAWPCKWLQEALNLGNQQGTQWADVPVSGNIGPLTMQALNALFQRRGVRSAEDYLLKCLNGDQYARYKAITLSGGPNNDQERNFWGWLAQRVVIAA